MTVVPLTVEHAAALVPQPHQASDAAWLRDPARVREWIAAGPAFAAVEGERVLAVGGVWDEGRGVGTAWCWLAAGLGAALIGVTWRARSFMRSCRFARLSMVTLDGFDAGTRWAQALGFDFEAPLRAQFPPDEGGHRRRDGLLWSRVRYG